MKHMNAWADKNVITFFQPHEPKSAHPDGNDGTTAYAVCKHCGSIYEVEKP